MGGTYRHVWTAASQPMRLLQEFSRLRVPRSGEGAQFLTSLDVGGSQPSHFAAGKSALSRGRLAPGPTYRASPVAGELKDEVVHRELIGMRHVDLHLGSGV